MAKDKRILTLESRPKKRRWPLIAGISVGAVFGILVVLVLLIPTFVSTNMAKSRIIDAMETNLGRKVEVDDIRMSWSDGVEVRNILIKEREGVPGDAFVKVDRFYCDIQFFPLIRKQIRIRELIIDNPEVVVHRYKETVFDGESKTPKSKQSSETEQVRVPEVAAKPVENQALSALALPFALDIELKAKINNGTFTFVDHRAREKTVINDLNTTLNIESLDKPIELKSAFNIEAKGETEHAEISMNVSLAKDGEVNPQYARGAFKAEMGFAKVIADFDMANFSGDGGQGFEFLLDVDTKGLTEKLAGILGLPEGLQMEGVCSSKITASGKFDKLINIDGSTELVNLNVSGGPFKDKPIKDLNIKLLQSADLDIVNDKIQIYRLGLESVFAQMGITGLVTDLRSVGNLDLKMFLQCDIGVLSREMGGLLPEDGEFSGKIQSNITLQGQRNKPRIDGKTVISDLFLKQGGSFGPLSEPEVLITHNATLDAFDKSLILREMGLITSFVELGSSGSLNHEKEVDVNVILSVTDLEKLTHTLAGIVSLPQGFTVGGKTTTELKIKGGREKGVRLSGNTVLDGVNATGGPLKEANISNLNVKLMHVLDHSMSRDEVTIEQLDIDSDFLTMRSKGEIKNLSHDMDVDYGASLNLNLKESTTLFSDFFPARMKMMGKGLVDFTLRGKLPVDGTKYDDMVFQGNMLIEKVEYIGNNITDLKAQFRLNKGIFNSDDFTFGLNEGEGKVFAKAILAEEQPSTEFRLDLTDVLINQKIDTLGQFIPTLSEHEGVMSGTLNMDIAAQGKGLNWQEELSKTLSAEGNIGIKNGIIKGDKVLSRIIRDEAFEFELTTPIKIEDGKIFTEDLQINGSKLDIGLSGWTAFDGRIEYTVESELLAKYIGGDAENILGMLGKGVHLPIVITGTVDKPKVALKLPKSKEGIEGLIEGIMGSRGKSKEGTKKTEDIDEPKGEVETGESSGEKEPEKNKTEEKIEKLFKSLFK